MPSIKYEKKEEEKYYGKSQLGTQNGRNLNTDCAFCCTIFGGVFALFEAKIIFVKMVCDVMMLPVSVLELCDCSVICLCSSQREIGRTQFFFRVPKAIRFSLSLSFLLRKWM